MKASSVDKKRCMGEYYAGAFQMGGSKFRRCDNVPIAIIDTADDKGKYRSSVCQECWDEAIKFNLPILKVTKIKGE